MRRRYSADWGGNVWSTQTWQHHIIHPWLSIFAHYCLAKSQTWSQLMLLCVTWWWISVMWSGSESVQKTHRFIDRDPAHAGMLECSGCVLNSAHLNDFFGTLCAPQHRQLLWFSLKTWAHKWRDMFWLLESLHMPLNTILIFYRPINSVALPN